MVRHIVVFFALIGLVIQVRAQGTEPAVVEIVAPIGDKLSFGVDDILSVGVPDSTRSNQIKFQVDGITEKAFTKLSFDNLGNQIVIRICGEQVSNPVIRDPLFGGEMAVSGFTEDEAKKIGDVLSGRSTCLQARPLLNLDVSAHQMADDDDLTIMR